MSAAAPRTRLGDDVLGVLSACDVRGARVFITNGQLDRKLYVRVNEALEALGGKWDRKARAHVFADDPADAIEGAIATGSIVRPKDLGWFPTPTALADDVVARANIGPGMSVLEPSAGEGALVDAILRREPTAEVTAVEIDEQRAKRLNVRTYCVNDFLDDFTTGWLLAGGRFDRVVMNPPFAKRADIAHVRHAFSMLKPGGRLVAIMSAGVEFREDALAREFRAFVATCRGSIERLPDGSFSESGTAVRTCLVTMEAP